MIATVCNEHSSYDPREGEAANRKTARICSPTSNVCLVCVWSTSLTGATALHGVRVEHLILWFTARSKHGREDAMEGGGQKASVPSPRACCPSQNLLYDQKVRSGGRVSTGCLVPGKGLALAITGGSDLGSLITKCESWTGLKLLCGSFFCQMGNSCTWLKGCFENRCS